jgi:3-oxoacyl-[acyl-carrier-protein] synthase II
MGAIGPCGLDVPTTWDCVRSGRSGIGAITRFDASDWSLRAAGEVTDFDPQAALGKKLADRSGRFIQFAVVASREAWTHAGLDSFSAVGDRTGVFVGTAIGGIPEICGSHSDLLGGGHRRVSPFFIPRSLTNIAAGQVAIALGARGPNGCPATACVVGNHVIGQVSLAIAIG